jgi:hypothetical protein
MDIPNFALKLRNAIAGGRTKKLAQTLQTQKWFRRSARTIFFSRFIS